MMKTEELQRILFLDIETVPLVYEYTGLQKQSRELWDHKWQFSKDTTPELHYHKAGIYAEFAKVVCIGFAYFEGGSLIMDAYYGDDEKNLLSQFCDLLNKKFNTDKHLLCAHNGKEFDFPFLCRRLLVNQLILPSILQIQGKKPWEIRHLDTMEMWKFGDYKNYTSLNLLAHIFGFPSPKNDMAGDMVAKVYYEENGLERIKEYCLKDVLTLSKVFCRLSSIPVPANDQIIFA